MKKLLYLLLLFPLLSRAQLAETEKQQLIDSVCKRLEDYYIYPKASQQMSAWLKKQNYRDVHDQQQFAELLTSGLISVSHDQHLSIRFDPEWVAGTKKTVSHQDSLSKAIVDANMLRKENYGFAGLKILDGNIGYLKLNNFADPLVAGETATSAMGFLRHSDAIIIDLRDNGGGFNTMVQLLASYFFDQDPVLLVEMYSRSSGRTTQDYTLPFVPGKRMPEIPLYILTSRNTFSAAESFSYLMKNRKRAVIIGETTGGGAHPIVRKTLNNDFYMAIPSGRPIDPVTHVDWEGTGVIPHFTVTSGNALAEAHIQALKMLSELHPENKFLYTWNIEMAEAERRPLSIDSAILKSYAGTYGNRKLFYDRGRLFYQREGDAPCALMAMKPDLFMVEEIGYMRLKIEKDGYRIIGLSRLYNDGSSRQDKRSGD